MVLARTKIFMCNSVDVGHSTLSKIKLPSVHSLEWMVPKDGAIKFSDPERTMDVMYVIYIYGPCSRFSKSNL